MPRKDLWHELTQEEKRTLRRDLAEHFRLRLNANEAVLQHLKDRLGRDPTMVEVAETRDLLMRKLEPEVRREISATRGPPDYERPMKNLEAKSELPPRNEPPETVKPEHRERGRPKLRLILGGKYRHGHEGRV